MKTRQFYTDMLLKLLQPLSTKYSESYTQLNLGGYQAGYGNKVAGMEGFLRGLWGLVPYWKSNPQSTLFVDIYQQGITNGVNPEHADYWGNLHNKDQRMVEMAAISYAILSVPDKVWNPLTDKAKKNLANWLYQINDYTQAENNWQFFKVMANIALKRVGMPYSQQQIEDAIAKYDSFYLGNGWYADGKRPQKDYYIPCGIHFYCLLYAIFMKEEDPERSKLYIEKAKTFAKTFIYWFDEDGRALPFGRSLTYRFVQAAFFSVYLLAGIDDIPVDVVKGIISRHLDSWMCQPIFDNAGVLTTGYYYPNLIMSEGYNSPGSPYWCLKTFLFLELPEDHAFWQAEEAPLPKLDTLKCISECDMLIEHRLSQCIAYTAGQYPAIHQTHAAEKYSKFAYSTLFGFSVPRSYFLLEECAPDSMLAFHVHGMYYVRRKCLEFKISDDKVTSKWSPVEGITVETTIRPSGTGHIRQHKIVSELSCTVYDCGFSYPRREENIQIETSEGKAIVRDHNGYGSIYSNKGKGKLIHCAPNTNLIFPNTYIPSIELPIEPGETLLETRIETQFINTQFIIGKGDCYETING
jgi:hypothetical protein